MSTQTQSEMIFEKFCVQNLLVWERVPEGSRKAPDYELKFDGVTVAVEIKQVESEQGFNPGGVSSRIVGSHIRHKIEEARAQIQTAALSDRPAILLIYNSIDPWQSFGTEQHDFICAMYGELTMHVRVADRQFGPALHGRNATLRTGFNSSFSGVGHLRRHAEGAAVTVYENVYAAHPLPFDKLPHCINVVRVEIDAQPVIPADAASRRG